MTVETPDARQPLTTPPAELVEATRGILSHMDQIMSVEAVLREGEPEPSWATQEAAAQITAGSADFLRQRFPHLDDVTLAAFCAYVATNITAAVTDAGLCPDSLRIAIVFADLAKHLAWSLSTLDGEGRTGNE